MPDLKVVPQLLTNLSALVLCAVGYAWLRHVASSRAAAHSRLILGAAGAVLAAVSMAVPIYTVDGGFLDARTAVLSIVTLTGGSVAGGLTAAAELLLRVSRGGPSVVPGAIGIVFCYLAALLHLARLKRLKRRAGLGDYGVLGCINAVLLAVAGFAYAGDPVGHVEAILVPVLAIAPLATIVLGAVVVAVDRALFHQERSGALRPAVEEILRNVPDFVALIECRPPPAADVHIRWSSFQRLDATVIDGNGRALGETRALLTTLAAETNRTGQWAASPVVWVDDDHGGALRQFSAFRVLNEPDGATFIGIMKHEIAQEYASVDAAERRRNFISSFNRVFTETVDSVKSGNLGMVDIARRVTEFAADALGADAAQLWSPNRLGDVQCVDQWDAKAGVHRQLPSVRVTDFLDVIERVQAERIVILRNDGNDARFGEMDLARGKAGIHQKRRAVMFIGTDMIRSTGTVLEVQAGYGRPDWSDEEKTLALAVGDLLGFLLLLSRHQQILKALDLVSDGLVATREDGDVVYANAAALGFSSEAEAASMLARGETLPISAFPVPLETGGPVEMTWESANGPRALSISRSELRGGVGVAVLRDVTEAKEAREAQDRLQRKVQQATTMETLGRLAGGLAHDFNNLLGAVIGFARFLEEDLDTGTRQNYYAMRILSACERGKEFVTQVLTFARAGNQQREVIAVGELLAETRDNILSLAPDDVQVIVESGFAEMLIEANRGQATQLLMNLISNAIAAVRDHGGQVRIAASRVTGDKAEATAHQVGEIEPSARYVRIDVADNGVGISPSDLPNVFEPFFTRRSAGGGTGLGLAVVSSIVSALNGACTVRSELGSGTIFSVYIPEALGVAPARKLVPPPVRLDGRERVLVVDDDVDVTDALTIGLECLGYETVGVNDPQAAIEVIAEAPDAFDVIVTDQMMPGLTGLQLVARSRALGAKACIILCTGLDDGTIADGARAAGADFFMPKPVALAALVENMRAWLDDNHAAGTAVRAE
jgi:signal transduction histidine kinase/ActR/RegA family two-component response regulator